MYPEEDKCREVTSETQWGGWGWDVERAESIKRESEVLLKSKFVCVCAPKF